MNCDSIEIERKYVIEIPSEEKMASMPEYTVSDIIQTYISSAKEVTHRVRKRVYPDRTVYTETKKIRIDKISAIEDEREISEEEYLAIRVNTKEGTSPLNKRRHTFVYEGQTFEVDVYPKWKRSCIMETELKSRDSVVKMPPFIKIIKEVTGDKSYSNASMSHAFPDECI